MKIIHSADIHLGSKLDSYLDKDKAKERSNELLTTFYKMIEYANVNNIKAIMIAGDLFDGNKGIMTLKREVFKVMGSYKDIDFYYLKGNHDRDAMVDEIPENIHVFHDQWTSYALTDHIEITGAELFSSNASSIYNTLNLQSDVFNIVTMHGQISQYGNKQDAEIINLNALKNHHIDYLALGHIHSYVEETLDVRGKYCYCGCLEGRGYDETGEHGFVVLDIDEDTYSYTTEFVPFASRNIHSFKADITDANTTYDAVESVRHALYDKNFSPRSMVEVVLTGEVDIESEIDTDLMQKQFMEDYYYIRFKNKTEYKIDYEQFKDDKTLKGEFIRTVMNSDQSDEDKTMIIRYGLKALESKEL